MIELLNTLGFAVAFFKYFPMRHQIPAKSPKEQSTGVYFDNMTLYLECRINKNALLQTTDGFFWRFCPLG